MSLRLIVVLASSLASFGGGTSDLAASPESSARSGVSLCNPDLGCSFTFVVTSVSVRAGTISGYNVTFPDDPVITTQITTTTLFQPPSEPCAPTDALYRWQQLVAAGANVDPEDPLHTAFLVEMQRFIPIDPVHLNVALAGFLEVVSAQPVSCSGR